MVQNDTGFFFFFFNLFHSSFFLTKASLSVLNFNIHFLQLNFLKHFLGGGGFIKHMQVGFLLAIFITEILVLLKNLLFPWLIYFPLLPYQIRKMSSFKMYLISHQREDILTTMNIGCLAVKRLVSVTDY